MRNRLEAVIGRSIGERAFKEALCDQIPARMTEGGTLVVTELISPKGECLCCV